MLQYSAPQRALSRQLALSTQPHALPQLQQPQPQFSYEYELQRGGRLGVNWDVLFFIRQIPPVSMAR